MATSIANLSVRISGDAGGFIKAVQAAQGGMRSLRRQAESVTGLQSALKAVSSQQTALGKVSMASAIVATKGAKAFNAGLDGTIKVARAAGRALSQAFTVGLAAITAATAAVTKFFVAGFEDIDGVSDMAKRIGISVESLSSLQYAAKQSDVEIEALNSGVSKMLVNIEKAAQGSREASMALADIGTSAEELKSMSPDQALEKIAEGIKLIRDPYKQAAAAQAIFGKSGVDMLPMLREGADGLRALADEARRTGVEVTAIEAGRIDALDEAAKTARAGMAGLAQTVASELSPYVTDLTNRLGDFITSSGGLRTHVAPALDFVLKGVGYLADGFVAIKGVVNLIRSGLLKMAEVALGAFSGVLKGINKVVEGVNKLSEWTGIGVEIGTINTSGIDAIRDAIEQSSSEFLDEGLGQLGDAFSGSGSKAIEQWREGIESAQKSAELAAAAISALDGLSGSARVAIQSLDDAAAESGIGELENVVEQTKAQIEALGESPIGVKAELESARIEVTGPSDQFASAATVGSAESNRLDELFRNQQARSATNDHGSPQVKAIKKSNSLLARIEKAITYGGVQVTEVQIA